MMASSILKAKTGRNACLNIEVDLSTDSVEGKDDVEAMPKETLDLVDRHERKS